jgi:hypothetical protein
MDKFVGILEKMISDEDFYNPLDYDDNKKDDVKVIDDLVNTGLMTIIILVIIKNLTVEQRIDCIEKLRSKMRTKYIKEYERYSSEIKVKDILSLHREDFIVEINRRIDKACNKLRDILHVA